MDLDFATPVVSLNQEESENFEEPGEKIRAFLLPPTTSRPASSSPFLRDTRSGWTKAWMIPAGLRDRQQRRRQSRGGSYFLRQ